ncbi:amino acid ABC transporter permease [Nocardioides insulae]|uniref:amino acid ABC transporter permease n=1 Tax=Nocardioides insulae TaxID=394734 RepID=UPI0004286143|nr:amino acid ABC transporter permease [Nocardioides insulae]
MSSARSAVASDGWAPSARQLEREQVARRLRIRRRWIASAVTVLVLAGLVAGVVSSPGWDRVREYFFSWPDARDSFAAIAEGFWINLRIFLVAEPAVLIVGTLVAITRVTVSPWLAPLRLLAVVYTDLLRGVPTLLVVALCGIGIPALNLVGVTTSLFWLTTFALVLCYGAYVAEVIRAGILAIHPTQRASAEALALTRTQTMRHVVLPQAVRRVVPPLMNDLVSLQKDTALISAVGVFEALRAAQDYQGYHFNGTSILIAAGFFLVVAVPLTRLTDWLMLRSIRREQGR